MDPKIGNESADAQAKKVAFLTQITQKGTSFQSQKNTYIHIFKNWKKKKDWSNTQWNDFSFKDFDYNIHFEHVPVFGKIHTEKKIVYISDKSNLLQSI